MSKEETFPIPLKYIDVTRTACTILEPRIEDFWNVDSRLTQSPATTIPGSVWPEFWSGMPESAQKKEKQEWAIEQLNRQRSKTGRHSFHRSGKL